MGYTYTLMSDTLGPDEIMEIASELYAMGLLSEEPKSMDSVEITVSPENEDEVLDILDDNEIYTIG